MKFPETHEHLVHELNDHLRGKDSLLPYTFDHAPNSHDRHMVLRKFLLARQLNVQKALKMIEDVTTHRSERSMDTLPLFPPPEGLLRGYDLALLQQISPKRQQRTSKVLDAYFAAMRTGFSGVYHKTDKCRRPLWIERTGRLDLARVLDHLVHVAPVGADPNACVMTVKEYINETWNELLEYQRRVHNDPSICQSTVIMDCEGLSARHLGRSTIGILQQFLQYDQRFFPEGVHRIYLVNVGYVVHSALTLIKPFLDHRVQEKIVLLKPNELHRLLDEVDRENLPEFLGGTCRCEGGCVPLAVEQMPCVPEFSLNHRILVPARQRTEHNISLKQGTTLTWRFMVDDKHSIVFSAVFADFPVVSQQKLAYREEPHEFSYDVKEDGVLTLIFDNSASWVSSKTLTLATEHLQKHVPSDRDGKDC